MTSEQLGEAEWNRMGRIFSEPRLKWTACELEGHSHEELPLMFDKKGRVIEAPTSFLFHLAVSLAAAGTIEHHAYCLRLYWSFLDGRNWREPDDALLRRWRNQMMKKVSGHRANKCLDSVGAFYRWAQSEGLVQHVIGETPPGGMPFPVRLVTLNRGKFGNKPVLAVRAPAGQKPRLPVPDIADVDEMYVRLSGPDEALSERNCRMADMALEGGLRREEICSMSIEDLPSREALHKLKKQGRPFMLSVTGKGRKTRNVPVLPELVEKLLSHIDIHRKTLLGKTTRRERAVFVSKKTGRRLTGSYVSRMFSKALGNEEQQKHTLHRLRARFASLLVLTLARREMNRRGLNGIREEMVLHAAAEVLGHGDLKTLQRYVDLSIRILQAEAAGHPAPTDDLGVDVNILGKVARQKTQRNHPTRKLGSTAKHGGSK